MTDTSTPSLSPSLSNEELDLLDRIAAATIEPVPPPAVMRERVLEAVRATAQFDTSVPSAEESVTIRADEGTWLAVSPGARAKLLIKDERRKVILVELDPHAIIGAHDHDGGEESYVIRGSCFIGGLALGVGDFHHTDAGSHHGDVVAGAEGCLLLLTMAVAA
jgi:anti-sigma factor ChrR (cupin superfamily)